MPRRLSREEYTVGWVCALPVELAAATTMLDEEHEVFRIDDNNLYCMGSIAGHNVVIASLPAGRIGNNSATAVATQMQAAFKGIRFGLMVGIGGGVPSVEADIRLGDVVVSQPQWTHGGVVQYDFGQSTPEGFRRVGTLNSPPEILLSAISIVRSKEMQGKSTLSEHVSTLERIPKFQRLKAGPDVLYDAAYNHISGYTCKQCSPEREQSRPPRDSGAEVAVHYGTIASGNRVIKDATERDRVCADLGGVLCFEMEAAGLMNIFPCLVIRGICDYADSHKNNQWQSYAAGTAAAYAKELLMVIPASDVMEIPRVEDAMRNPSKRDFEPLSTEYAVSKRRKHDLPSSAEDNNTGQLTVTLPVHHHQRNRPSINDEQKRNLLDSLRFKQIDARQMTIKSPHAETCKWLLKSPQYLDWLDMSKLSEHHGFLWVKGKAGAGKSTLMKFAMINARRKMKGCTVIDFFFNARGEDLEKSTIGTYRSLLLQLLEAIPESQSIFDSLDIPASAISADQQWSVEPLKTLLEQAIRSLGQSSAVCFIDALDECEEEQVREMVQFLEHITDLAMSNGICFKVCVSSRHYPHITIRHGLELVLEGNEGHAQDIANYIDTKLRIGDSETAKQAQSDLRMKASGVFLWVVLVVGMLNREYDHGQVHALRKKLQEIPGDLHELFRDILTRDPHDKDLLVLCIRWVLFAKQPLSPEQLHHALLSSKEPAAISGWDPKVVTVDDINRFLLHSSKGLTEVTASSESKVQFIHESVRDFLLKENGLSKIWPEFMNDFHGQSHERLKQCCLDYIKAASKHACMVPNKLPKASSEEAAVLRTSTTRILPFLEYAVCNVLYHAERAEGGGISQAKFLEDFALPQWVELDNLFEKDELCRHTGSVSLLYLLAELNMANLIKALGSASQCMDVEAERCGCPLFAAAAASSEKTLELFMDSMGIQLADRCSVHTTTSEHTALRFLWPHLPRGFVYSKEKGMLFCAAELGLDQVLCRLIRSGKFDIDSKDLQNRSPLWWAAYTGCASGTRLLLSAGSVMINSMDENGRTPLSIAARHGNKAVVELLLHANADIHDQSTGESRALAKACLYNHKEIAMLFLNRGADVNAQVGYYGTALQGASRSGHKDIVELLLDKGADVNAQNGGALKTALDQGHGEIVALLQKRMASETPR